MRLGRRGLRSRLPPRTGQFTLDALAPSISPGYHFTVHLTGAWTDPAIPTAHNNAQAIATDHALTVVQDVAARRYLTDTAAAEARINAVLREGAYSNNRPVELLWAQTQLTAAPRDIASVIRLLRDQYDAAARDQLHHERIRRAEELRDTLLSDPSLALAYWFADRPDTVSDETIKRVETLISTVVTYTPKGTWVQLAQLLTEFNRRLDADERAHLLTTLAHLANRHGHRDIAEQISAIPLPPAAAKPEDAAAKQRDRSG